MMLSVLVLVTVVSVVSGQTDLGSGELLPEGTELSEETGPRQLVEEKDKQPPLEVSTLGPETFIRPRNKTRPRKDKKKGRLH